jgi:hypothetical protein
MHLIEHTQLNRCCDHLARIPVKHHRFLYDLKRLQKNRPYLPLTSKQRKYLFGLHCRLVNAGVVVDVEVH